MGDDREIQIFRKKNGTVVIRSKPRNPPSEGQLKARITFTAVARGAIGRHRSGGLPPAAEAVSRSMKGASFGRVAKLPLWKQRLLKSLEDRGYTKEEALVILESLK